MSWFTEAEDKRLIEMYNAGVTLDKIADELYRETTTIAWRVNKLIEKGELVKREQPKRSKKTEVKKGQRPNCLREKPEPKADGECINCTDKVKKNCYYGQRSEPFMCNFCLIEGHSRGCSPRACTKFRTSKSAKELKGNE